MKKLIWLLMLLLFLLPVQTSIAKEYFVVATGFIGGTAGKLDAIECEDIKGVNPPTAGTAITTGTIALVTDSNKVVAVYRYNASGTDSEDATNYTIIVPDDRAADCSGNGQWEKADKHWLNEAIILDDGSGNTLTLGDGTALGSNKVVGTDELSYLIGVTSGIQAQITAKEDDTHSSEHFSGATPGADYFTCTYGHTAKGNSSGKLICDATSPNLAIGCSTTTLSSDHTISSNDLVAEILAGESAVDLYEPVFLDGDGKLYEADANVVGEYPAVGLAVSDCSADTACVYLVSGCVRDETWSWANIGTDGWIYLSTTNGQLTQTPPSTANDCIQIVGYAVTSKIAKFNFNRPYQLVE